MHPSPCVKQTARGDLQCDAGRSAQGSVAPRGVGWGGGVGGRSKREGMCIPVADSC